MNKLEQPDKHSKSPEHGGRRIVRLDNHRDWGWQIVNYKTYNQFKDPEAKRSYFREYRRKTREAKKQCSPPVQPCSTPFKKNTPVAVAVAVTVTDTHTPKPPKPGLGDVSDFDKFYEAYPNQKAKADALKAWNQTEPGTKNAYPIKRPSLVDLLAAVEAQKVAGCLDGHDGGQWTPLPATWLRKGRWTDQNSSAPQAEPAIIPSWATLTEPPHA